MGYTYIIPENFEQRVRQYVRQLSPSCDLQEALDCCSYEYDEIGNAYYAALRWFAWDEIRENRRWEP